MVCLVNASATLALAAATAAETRLLFASRLIIFVLAVRLEASETTLSALFALAVFSILGMWGGSSWAGVSACATNICDGGSCAGGWGTGALQPLPAPAADAKSRCRWRSHVFAKCPSPPHFAQRRTPADGGGPLRFLTSLSALSGAHLPRISHRFRSAVSDRWPHDPPRALDLADQSPSPCSLTIAIRAESSSAVHRPAVIPCLRSAA